MANGEDAGDEDAGSESEWRVTSVLTTPDRTSFFAERVDPEEEILGMEPRESLDVSAAGDGDVFLHAWSEGEREGNAKIVLPRRVVVALRDALTRFLEE